MSKFFTAMQQAAGESGATPSLPMPDIARFSSIPLDSPELPVVEELHGQAANYRQVTPRPVSSRILPPLEGPYLRVAEQYRIIRTKIVQSPAKHRLLAVSSAGIGDGKTVSAINIAGALALKAGTSVLLVDADFRRPRVAEALGIASSPGLADVLRGDVRAEEAIIRLEGSTSLFVLPSGEAVSNPTELLDNPHWGLLAEALRDCFDYVVVDAPPVGLVADYDLIQAAVDAAILVVRIDHSSRLHCLRVFKAVPKQKLLGIIMNGIPDWFLTRASVHDYGYYQRRKKEDPSGTTGAVGARKDG
jgi:capsular exopolysaccharide synthesis family protein